MSFVLKNTEMSLSYCIDYSSKLKQIADHYILHGLFEQNYGLFNGQMGMSIFFFYYSRHTNNSIYANFAGELLDNVCANLSYNTPITFVDGLCGIGWGIELLKKNKFIEADTDSILLEVDEKIMERDVLRVKDYSLETGLKGILAFVQSRLHSERTKENKHIPFDTLYLSNLYTICKNFKLDVDVDEYNIDNLWNVITKRFSSYDSNSWQMGLSILKSYGR